MKTVSRVGVLSLAKFEAVLFGAFGVPTGLVLFFASVAGGSIAAGVFFLMMVPVVQAAGGFIVGIVSGWIYNLTASAIGGVQIRIEDA